VVERTNKRDLKICDATNPGRAVLKPLCGDYEIYTSIKDWPNFTWDSDILAPLLAEVRYLLGQLEGRGFKMHHLHEEASLATRTEEVVKSSAIEGEKLDAEQVRSSIACHLKTAHQRRNFPQPEKLVHSILNLEVRLFFLKTGTHQSTIGNLFTRLKGAQFAVKQIQLPVACQSMAGSWIR